MKLTKEEFKAESKTAGYNHYRDLVVELGYGHRYLDKYTYQDVISESFLKRFETWKSGKPLPEMVAETPMQTPPALSEKVHVGPYSARPPIVPEQVPEQVPEKVQQGPKSGRIGADVTNRIYHASSNLSATRIKLILENAAEFHDVYISGEAKKKYTDALLIGSIHHTLVMEPEKFNADYIVLGLDAPVKQDLVNAVEKLGGKVNYKENSKGELVAAETMPILKEMLNELRDKELRTIVTKKQVELAQETAKKALESWYVIESGGKTLLKAQLKEVLELKTSHVERTFYGEICGVKVQVRPDILVDLGNKRPVWFCIDLKTAEDATMAMFAKQSARFYYDLQQWVYTEVLRQNGIDVVDFRFCVSGKAEHSKTAFYKMHTEDIEDAEKVAKKAIKKYNYCVHANEWGESRFDFNKMRFEPVSTIQLPTWRKFQLIDMGVL